MFSAYIDGKKSWIQL